MAEGNEGYIIWRAVKELREGYVTCEPSGGKPPTEKMTKLLDAELRFVGNQIQKRRNPGDSGNQTSLPAYREALKERLIEKFGPNEASATGDTDYTQRATLIVEKATALIEKLVPGAELPGR